MVTITTRTSLARMALGKWTSKTPTSYQRRKESEAERKKEEEKEKQSELKKAKDK